MCERVSHTSVSQNVSLSSPGAPPLSPPPSDRCHLCIVCVRRDCSRHFPLWLAFTQCNQCCSCLKRPLVQHLSNARFPDASTTLLVAPFRLGDKRQTVWRACVKPLDLPLCLTALALFWTCPSVVYGLTVLVKNCHGRKLEILTYRLSQRIVPVCGGGHLMSSHSTKAVLFPNFYVFWTRMKWLTGESIKMKFGSNYTNRIS